MTKKIITTAPAWGLLLLLVFFVACQQQASTEADQQESTEEPNETEYAKIVSLSGAITEALFNLGHGDKLVGIDVTSTYPADQLASLARLGHVRNLNVEGVLALEPDLILVEKSDADKEAITKLSEAGVALEVIEKEESLQGAIAAVEQLANLLGGEEQLGELKTHFQQKEEELKNLLSSQTANPKVLFIYARGKGSMMVAGKNTPAETIIGLAGGQNAVQDLEGFKPLSVEGLVAAQPDVLLLFESGLKSIGGEEGLATIPGVSQTPAGQKKQVIAMDGLYLLGFTPRAADAALDLAQQLSKYSEDEQLSQN